VAVPVTVAVPVAATVTEEVMEQEEVEVPLIVAPAPVVAPGPDPGPGPAPAPVPAPETAAPITTAPASTISAPELSLFLASSDPAERRKGIDNLAARRDSEADRTLAWVAVHDDDSTVRSRAWVKVVERMHAGYADYDVLLPLVVRQMSAGERTALQAIDLYVRFGDDADDFAGALAHSSAKVRLAGLDGVAAIGGKFPENGTGYVYVGPLTDDPDPAVAKRAKDVLNRR
jgi:hypothetical protein